MPDINLHQAEVPTKSALISQNDFLQQTEITQERLEELLELGWLQPAQKTENALMFNQQDVYRVRKLERLCLDFEISALPAAIIVDLLAKVESLEAELVKLRGKE